MNQKKTIKPKQPTQTQPSRAVREFTAGGVVYRGRGSELEILMIQDHKGRWTIPKGHVEKGEKLEQTALREIGEETGLKHLKIRHKLDNIYFFYRRAGKLIFMTTSVFLTEATKNTNDLKMGDSEGIIDVKWFKSEEALKLIEYKDTEKLFRMGLEKLKS
ncbi:MAG TPA: NUDIX domain-containing protein [Candidatus Saccharimonadales bacterium]|nr:NUDIX domain-containing protein [Candidatus Saccharimonadales bacterium]